MKIRSEHDELFQPVIWCYVESFNKAKDSFVQKKLKEGLKEALKKWTDQKVKMVSKSVLELANLNNINPFKLMWPDRNVLGVDNKNKSLIVWEHSTPLNELYLELVKCKSEVEIEIILNNYSGVCWITREEDNFLNSRGYRAKRPGGWKKCYWNCGIEITTEQ